LTNSVALSGSRTVKITASLGTTFSWGVASVKRVTETLVAGRSGELLDEALGVVS
jgi:hypothetical protein